MRILVYGDSNSWGYLADGLGLRYPRCWPEVLAGVTGWNVFQDCLPGRTTVHDDPDMDVGVGANTWNGLTHLESSILAASPLDAVLIMLGTNDLKARFKPSAGKVAANILKLAQRAAATPACAPWQSTRCPVVALIVPPPLGRRADDPKWERAMEWRGARGISLALAAEIRKCAPKNIAVFAAEDFGANSSQRDPIHWEADQHEAFGQRIAPAIQDFVLGHHR